MQAKPATASGLIRAGPLQNATSAKPGAAQTYSVAAGFGELSPHVFAVADVA
ncbi:unnamed protein product [Trifolium pratense]|uniref:Uncharacterized protein n=1 Tax=Trifolium pratense TaxID=57577 RepID=A0ACB0JTU1_TRIPR|nr:unnamed protein product [Trifolium pratense]